VRISAPSPSGFALNVDADLRYFEASSCGSDKRTSLAALLGAPVDESRRPRDRPFRGRV
jgi:lipoate-protein ligase B